MTRRDALRTMKNRRARRRFEWRFKAHRNLKTMAVHGVTWKIAFRIPVWTLGFTAASSALANEGFWKGPCADVVEVIKVVVTSLRTLEVDVSSCQIGDLVDSAGKDGYKCPRGHSEISQLQIWCSFYSDFFFCYLILHLWDDRPCACRKDNRYPSHLDLDPASPHTLQMPTPCYLITPPVPSRFYSAPCR